MLASELRAGVLAGRLDPSPQPADHLATEFGDKLERVVIVPGELVVQAFGQALGARHLEMLRIKVRVIGTRAQPRPADCSAITGSSGTNGNVHRP